MNADCDTGFPGAAVKAVAADEDISFRLDCCDTSPGMLMKLKIVATKTHRFATGNYDAVFFVGTFIMRNASAQPARVQTGWLRRSHCSVVLLR